MTDKSTPVTVTANIVEAVPPAALDAAQEAGLRYVLSTEPGVRRVRAGRGMRYLSPEGKPVTDRATLQRIKALAIPPAWQQVWICIRPDGHLQATGRDARGRKQYRYHARWRSVRDESKYDRLLNFGRALPGIRRKVKRDLALPGMPREKILATVVKLLELTLIRVGNDEYARQNESFGLTTLRNRHVRIQGTTVTFSFRGKSGIQHDIDFDDPRLAAIIRRSRDLPGYELFQYVTSDGQRRSVDAADVNAYLHEVTGEDFTAKDFRTWKGTVLAARALMDAGDFQSQREAARKIKQAVTAVASQLGNTPAICRKCYIHPDLFDAYQQRYLAGCLTTQKRHSGLSVDESRVLDLLKRRSTRSRKRTHSSGVHALQTS